MLALSWNECIIMLLIIIDFYALITYNYIRTILTAAGAEFISSHRRCSLKFCKFHRKTPVLESLIYKVASLQGFNFTKKDPYTGVFLWNLRNSEEHLFWRTSERLLLCVDYFIMVSGKMPLGKKPPGKMPPRKLPPRKMPPGKLPPRKIVSLDFCCF